MQTNHIPVLLDEVIDYLNPQPGNVIIDGTLGGGGHTEALAKRVVPGGRVIGIDRDPKAVERSQERLKQFGNTIIYAVDSYTGLARIARDAGYQSVDGIVLDLGLSSDQLDTEGRGFSFKGSAPLDMRYGVGDVTARDLVNECSEQELTRIFREYGDERFASRIARHIAQQRTLAPIETTDELVAIIDEAYRGKPRPRTIHFATKVFQALRIAVNDEFGAVRTVIPEAISLLKPGGRLAIITFHSGEDEIVKNLFRMEAKGCLCPPRLPVCVCGHVPRVTLITKKAVKATDQEQRENPRSRSAQLRVVEKKP